MAKDIKFVLYWFEAPVFLGSAFVGGDLDVAFDCYLIILLRAVLATRAARLFFS